MGELTLRVDDARAAAIAARCEAATPGPWKADLDNFGNGVEACVSSPEIDMLFCADAGPQDWGKAKEAQPFCDAEFIAECRTDLPDLLADRAALLARVAELEDADREDAAALDALRRELVAARAERDAERRGRKWL